MTFSLIFINFKSKDFLIYFYQYSNYFMLLNFIIPLIISFKMNVLLKVLEPNYYHFYFDLFHDILLIFYLNRINHQLDLLFFCHYLAPKLYYNIWLFRFIWSIFINVYILS